jgi:hypothetical protein
MEGLGEEAHGVAYLKKTPLLKVSAEIDLYKMEPEVVHDARADGVAEYVEHCPEPIEEPVHGQD